MLARNSLVAAVLFASSAYADPTQAPDFHRYSVPVYAGPRAAPDFAGPGKQYLTYRTVIRDGFLHNPITAGHFTIISAGCGAGCILYWYGELHTGRIETFPIGGENYPGLTLSTNPGSRLVVAKWDDPQSGACTSRSYLLRGAQFFREGSDRAMRKSCEEI
jgi:hypothetical protein